MINSEESKRETIVRIAKIEAENPRTWRDYLQGPVEEDAIPYVGNVAWCGIFCLWVLQRAGVAPPDMHWRFGRGFLYRLPRANEPEPGDVAYFNELQHHAIVLKVEGGRVYTVDGNQPGETVGYRVRPLETVAAFYSVEPWL